MRGGLRRKGSEKAEKVKEAVNGTKEVNECASANGEENAVAEGAAKIDLNGAGATTGADAYADADIAAPTDGDAPGEADGDADVSGQADAPGEAEDIAMTEA
ncbi:hypothetical protein DXG01_008394 [Tephrocybe rancida]|nr:hypothetical protein DXG01_008394 [Tephrocybe rancida]